jgi:hypothetical protein
MEQPREFALGFLPMTVGASVSTLVLSLTNLTTS